jgi:cell division FtsZ-interacting protein ZapD
MIEYPKDRLYLRVGVLLTQLKSYANDKGNLEMYAYFANVSRLVSPNDIDEVIKTEKHILSPNFLDQNCFKQIDKENLRPIIREYKLNMLV